MAKRKAPKPRKLSSTRTAGLVTRPSFFQGLKVALGGNRAAARELRVPESTFRGLVKGSKAGKLEHVAQKTFERLRRGLAGVEPKTMRAATRYVDLRPTMTPIEERIVERKSERARRRAERLNDEDIFEEDFYDDYLNALDSDFEKYLEGEDFDRYDELSGIPTSALSAEDARVKRALRGKITAWNYSHTKAERVEHARRAGKASGAARKRRKKIKEAKAKARRALKRRRRKGGRRK